MPVSFGMLAESALIIFLTLAAAIFAGHAIDTAFGPGAAPLPAPWQQEEKNPSTISGHSLEAAHTAAPQLPVLSPSKQASVDDEVAEAVDPARWGLEQLNGGWQAATEQLSDGWQVATQQLDKVSRSLLNAGDAPAAEEPASTSVDEDAAGKQVWPNMVWTDVIRSELEICSSMRDTITGKAPWKVCSA